MEKNISKALRGRLTSEPVTRFHLLAGAAGSTTPDAMYAAYYALGVALTVAFMITLVTLLAVGISTLPVTWGCFFGLTFGFGIALPASTALILAIGSEAPGAASGLLGGARFLLGAAAAPLPGLLGGTTVLSTAVAVLGFVLLSAVAPVTLARPWQDHGEPVGRRQVSA